MNHLLMLPLYPADLCDFIQTDSAQCSGNCLYLPILSDAAVTTFIDKKIRFDYEIHVK